MKKSNLENQIKLAQDAYYNGSSIMDDDEYDALIYELGKLDPNNSLLSKIGATPVEEWKKEKHLIPLGSLNKVNFPNEMSKWIKDTLQNKEVLVSEKLDGLSLGCQYENGKLVRACLRGNGLEGENILINVIKMKGNVNFVPGFNGTIRGEIILTKSDHEKYFQNYSNPRNAASGLCRRLDGNGCEHLTLIFYQAIGDDDFDTELDMFKFLTKHGFNTPNYKLCKTDKEVNDLWKEYQDKTRSSLNWEIDGLVVYCNDIAFQQSLGEINLKSKGKLAFKFANQFIKTVVKEVIWSCGNSGRITPVCWFEPVDLLGSTIEKASVYNIAYINNLKLDIGAEILVCKANEIIPRVEKVIKSTGTTAKMPKHCPSCGSQAEMDGENLMCLNTYDCPAQLKGRILNWVKELNLLEWGTGLVDKLVEAEMVFTVDDLYKLTVGEIASLDRMGDTSAQKAYDILWANTNLSLDILLGALSIPMIGGSTIRAIMKSGCDTLEKFGQLKAEHFEQVPGVGPTKAKSLADGLQRNQKVILSLLDLGITVKDIVQGSLTNKSVCFTGTMINKRAALEKMAADAGAEVKNSVGKNLTYLVINDLNSTSSKAVAAKKLGTVLIDENQFLDLVK